MNAPLIHQIVSQFGAPEGFDQVKAASDHGPGAIYADRARKEYPIHTKEACWVSAARAFALPKLGEGSAPSEVVQGEIVKAAMAWGIHQQVQDTLQAFKVEVKRASDDEFALVTQHPRTGETIRAYRVSDAQSVKVSASLFASELALVGPELRTKIATTILDAADAHAADISDVIEPLERAAGRGLSTNAQLKQAAAIRASQLRAEHKHEEATKIAQLASEIPETGVSHELCTKVAHAFRAADEAGRLARFYGKGLESPEDACFALTKSAAVKRAAQVLRMPTGSIYETSDLVKISSYLRGQIPELRTLKAEELPAAIRGMTKESAVRVECAFDLFGIRPRNEG